MPARRSHGRVLLVVLALLLSAIAPLALAQGPPEDGPPDDHPDEDDNPGNDSSDEARSQERRGPPDDAGPPDHAGPPAGVGRVTIQDGQVEGTFLSLDIIDDGIANVTLRDTVYFDTVHVQNLSFDEIRADGARVRLEGEAGDADVEYRLHDTPTTPAQIEVDDEAVLEFALADGVDATRTDDSRVELSADGSSMQLWLEDGELSLDNGTITVADDAEVRLLVSASGGSPGDAGAQIAEAAAKGRVGAEVRMLQGRDELRSEAVTYGNLSVMTSKQADGVLAVVSSDDEDGKAIVLHADRALFSNGSADFAVRYDGENISQADDLSDVLEIEPGEEPEYVLVVGESDVQALVAVPSFSTHTIEVSSVGSTLQQIGLSPQQAAAAFVAAALTVAVAAGVAGKR